MIASFPTGWEFCESGLTLAPDGNFYGACEFAPNGLNSDGLIYQVTPQGGLSLFHQFTGATGDYAPLAPPIVGPDGNLYGVTEGNGSTCGNFYRLTLAGVYTNLLEFSPSGTGNCSPSNLFLANNGDFYGTLAKAVGFGDDGAVFQITTKGALKLVYGFTGVDGISLPRSGVTQGENGKLYGATGQGGTNNNGVIYSLTTGGKLTVLYNIDNATDAAPSILSQASNGNFYGYSPNGGIDNQGGLFELTAKNVFSAYLFNGAATPPTSSSPLSPLLQHTNGTIYGTTNIGPNGVVYAEGEFLAIGAQAPAFITALPATGEVGTEIGILGQGFTSQSVVSFNGKSASFTLVSGTFLSATVPAGATTGYVTVTTPSGTLKTTVKFKVKG